MHSISISISISLQLLLYFMKVNIQENRSFFKLNFDDIIDYDVKTSNCFFLYMYL